MRKIKKFAAGGSSDRAQARYDRMMADIKKDYEKARAKNPDIAKAKMEQRMADAKDDLAKARGEDRSSTRAAEKAAERALSEARRTKGRSVAASETRSSLASRMEDTPTRVSVSEKVDVGPTPSLQQKKETPRPARRPAASSGSSTSRGSTSGSSAVRRPVASGGGSNLEEIKRKGAALRASFTGPPATGGESKPAEPMRAPSGTGRGRILSSEDQRRLREARERGRSYFEQGAANVERIQGMSERDKVRARMRELGVPGYAKGGKIDGCAVRGKTKAKRG